MGVSMAGGHSGSGHCVNTAPVASSVRVMRAPGALPYSPIQRALLRRAVASSGHQPLINRRFSTASVAWKRSEACAVLTPLWDHVFESCGKLEG